MIDPYAHWNGSNDKHSDRGGPEAILHMSEHLPFLDACQRILDVGAGCGALVAHFKAHGKEAEGITYQPSEVERARTRGITLKFGDMHDLPWDAESFDGVLLWDVLEHSIAPLVVLREIHRVLTPEGRLLIFVPGQKWARSWYHILVPTQTQVRHLLELAGFTQTTCIDYSGEDAEQAVYKVRK